MTNLIRALSSDRRWFALVVLCAGMLMIVLDETIVNVALPSIQRDLGFTQAGLAWVVNAYLIAFGGLLLLAGRVGDLVGRKRVMLAGLFVFTMASLACGLSRSQEMLVVARFVQGAGGAMTSALILGMIVAMFPEPREQARAIGVFSFVASAGGSIGLLGGGVLTQAVNWHWIFFVNLPIGVCAAVAAARLLETDPGLGLRRGADVIGAVLVTSALMLAVYTIVGATDPTHTTTQTAALGVVSVALLAAFVWRQATVVNPLLPLGIFRSARVSGANLVQALMVAGMFGMFFMGTLYLQRVLGYDALSVGLAFLPVAVLIGVFSVDASARLTMRLGARSVLIGGLTSMLVGLAFFARAPLDGQYVVDILPVMLLTGIGAGVSFPALMSLAMSDVAADDAGLASGLVNTTAQVGGAMGLAILATIAALRTDSLVGDGASELLALSEGYRLAFAASAGFLLAAVLVAAVVLKESGDSPEAALAGEEWQIGTRPKAIHPGTIGRLHCTKGWTEMDVYLLDGTYELFRHHFALPSAVNSAGREVAATRGVLGSVLGMLESGVSHIGVATDHVIESFRNEMWPGYKTSAGMDPSLLQQFPLFEEVMQALGVAVWPMIELEADDALGTAASIAAAAPIVDTVYICTPDKDLGQCVVGTRVVQLDRRWRKVTDEAGVIAKFGVPPASIPDYLALVGDSADGFPGLSGWGAKSASAVLARYGHIEAIPAEARAWEIGVRGARLDTLAATLRSNLDLALLFRTIATVRTDAPIAADVKDLRWQGPTPAFEAVCAELGSPDLVSRANRAAARAERALAGPDV